MKEVIKYLSDGNLQIGILIILLAFYIITKSAFFGFLTLLSMVLFLIIEFYVGSKTHGTKKEVIETIFAFLVAFIIWNGLVWILDTPSPVSAVVSCSMVDSINRGDMIIVKGEKDYRAVYELQVEKEDIERLNDVKAEVIYKGNHYVIEGSLFSYCQTNNDFLCNEFKKNPSKFVEKRGNFEFYYGICERESKTKSIILKEPCLKKIKYINRELEIKRSNFYKGDVVVYIPKSEDLFFKLLGGGDIIHRALIKLETEDEVYYITKGDNNNIADFQFYSPSLFSKNSVVNKEQIKGKMLFKLPFLGYYKLFLIGSFSEGELCDLVLK